MRVQTIWFILVTVVAVAGGGAVCVSASDGDGGYVSTRGRWLVDGQGRVLILHGVNVCDASKRPPFLPPYGRDAIARLRGWGFDSVRYLIVWEAVEPKPGEYDDAYLDQVAQRLQWCREAGLRVIIDMHQDIFSRKYGGDGAPDWACLDGGLPFTSLEGPWYVNYAAPAVIHAFTGIWINEVGPGGVGIQDRFIAAWRHVAERFRDDTNVIGYDLLNEPYYGAAVYAMLFSLADVLGKELDPQTRSAALQLLYDTKAAPALSVEVLDGLVERGILLKVLDEASGPGMQFERRMLQPFYNRLVAAIREVDMQHICFFEPAGASGTRLQTGIDVPTDRDGKGFANVVFAPHHYDFWRDFGLDRNGPPELLEAQLERALGAAAKMNVPTWFGEWGAISGNATAANELVQAHLDAFDRLMCGWAWWEYSRGFGDLSFRPLLSRAHARVIAGVPTRMRHTGDTFELSFDPLPEGGETVLWSPSKCRVQIELVASGDARYEQGEDGLVRVFCPPGVMKCTVTLHLSR